MSASGHCALARANRDFGTDMKRIRTKITVMQLLRNNCLYRKNVIHRQPESRVDTGLQRVALVAANGRAKNKSNNGFGLLLGNIATLQLRRGATRVATYGRMLL